MPGKRFTNEQIAFALRQAENGATVDEVYRKMGVFIGAGHKDFAGDLSCAPCFPESVLDVEAERAHGLRTFGD